MSGICQACQKLLSGKQIKFCSTKCGNLTRDKKWRDRNQNFESERKRAWSAKNPKQYILSRIKSKALKYKIPFNLSLEDIIIPEYCPVLGIKLSKVGDNVGSGYHHNSPSLDKIKPSLGYIRGNVRIISSRANLLKNDASLEELELVIKDLKRLTHG